MLLVPYPIAGCTSPHLPLPALHPLNCRKTMPTQVSESALEKYRYEILFGAWLAVTGATFLRIKRQPYSTRLKIEQYESIFKGTSLGAVLIGIGITPARSTARRF
ncbi:hypothetical protein PTTW11_04079 [Pyrenophora teres f. teres]|uniref:Uncharacterized protein n=1 Tax=Pyrenophora teres f. teres TaxID=97479 RepID=A0A6S6VYN8_9PLEO|nr:hypothetical protein PTTW11_04079 [Pyrenophora teres f. teres]